MIILKLLLLIPIYFGSMIAATIAIVVLTSCRGTGSDLIDLTIIFGMPFLPTAMFFKLMFNASRKAKKTRNSNVSSNLHFETKEELQNYFKQSDAYGISRKDATSALYEVGWTKSDLDNYL